MINDSDLAVEIEAREQEISLLADSNPLLAATMYQFFLESHPDTANAYKLKINRREDAQDLLAMVDTGAKESEVRSMLLYLYANRLDRVSNLIRSPSKLGYTSFEIETNYYFIESLLKIADQYPSLSVFAFDMAKVVISSVMTNFYTEKLYSDTGAGYYRPDFYYVIHRRDDNGEIEKLTDHQGLGLLIGMKISQYYVQDDAPYLQSPYERLRTYKDPRTYVIWNNARLMGEQSGLLTKTRVIETEGIEDVQYIEKYPFRANIVNNLRFNYSDELDNLPAFPLELTFLDERTPPIVSSDAALSLVELYRQRHAPKFPAFRMNYLGIDSLATKFPVLESQNIAQFSWENMPTRWHTTEDKTTRDFHDAFLSPQQTIHELINHGLQDAVRDNNETIINWFAFINGVNKNHILNLPLQARKNLGIKNKWVQKRRSTTTGFNIFQVLLMNDFRPFKLNKPYQPFKTTVHRYTTGGIWAFEIQPGEYNDFQIPRIWKAVSDSYTSARYLLIITALNALSDLGNHSRQIEEYAPHIEYPVNAIVSFNHDLYRKLIKGTQEAPLSTRAPWGELTDTTITVGANDYDPQQTYRRNAIVIYRGRYYQLYADEIVGKQPDLPYTFWGLIEMNREYRDEHLNNVFYSGIACTNASLPCTNSEAYHLSTAFRFPGTNFGDYSFRLHEKPFPRRDIMLGYLSEYLILNVPTLKRNNVIYKKTSPYILQNENQTHWGNILEDWMSADQYYEGRNQ